MEEQYLSAAEVAKHLGVHYRTVENWAAQEFLERKDGKYGLISALKHRIEQLESEVAKLKDNPRQELQLQKLAAEVEERKAIARIKNMEADLMAGKLVDAEEAMNAWKNAIANVKAKLLSLPAKLALELSGISSPKKIMARLRQVIDEALREFGEN